jgi:hypothetical protein
MPYATAAVRERVDVAPGDAELLGAWIALLAWYSGSDEVVVGLATGAARIDLADEPDGNELLARVTTALATPTATIGDAAIRYRAGRPDAAELALDLTRTGDATLIELFYAPELFDESTARDMLGDLLRLLRALQEMPDDPVPDITLRSITETEVIR